MALLLNNPDINDLLCGQKYLIINAPAVDIRLPWASWHHPYGPLLIGTEIKRRGFDVRFIDALQAPADEKLPRTKNNTFNIDGYKIDNWRFGTPTSKIIATLKGWKKDGWLPDAVFVSCAISYWWPATSELVSQLKKFFNIPVYLGGGYPTAYPEHALSQTEADIVVVGSISGLSCQSTDFEIYKPLQAPLIAAVRLFTINANGETVAHPKEQLVEEIVEKAKLGVSKFVLFDEKIGRVQRQDFIEFLQAIKIATPKVAATRVRASIIAPGNISPDLIDKDLAVSLKEANCSHLYFHDDVVHRPYEKQYPCTTEDYIRSVQALSAAGYRLRTEQVGAAVVIGLPGEDIREITKRVAELSSIVGSVHLVPYQYSPNSPEGREYSNWLSNHNGHLDISHLNGKLFPLARIAGRSIEDYIELTRLVALLNSKHNSLTFDFSGNSLVSTMVRKSLESKSWNPFNEKKEAEEVSL